MTAPAPRNHPAEDAHPAPTPAPVAAPEGGWLTDAEWRDFQSIPEQGYSHRSWVNARITERVADEREKVASLLLSSAGASVEEAASWAMTGRRHAARIVRTGDVDPNGVATSRSEPVVAPLPSEVGALVLAKIGSRTIPLELQATGIWLSPGRHGSYIAADIDSWVRLVPEDDEDTVRPRCPGCDRDSFDPVDGCERCGHCGVVDEDTVRVPREELDTLRRQVAAVRSLAELDRKDAFLAPGSKIKRVQEDRRCDLGAIVTTSMVAVDDVREALDGVR